MTVLKNWRARRAGGRITLTAVDAATDQPIKVVGVDVIESTPDGVIATDKNGGTYRLT